MKPFRLKKTVLLSFLFLFPILISCQNKKTLSSQISEEKSSDQQMEKIVELYNSKKYADFIKLAEIELNKPENDNFILFALSDAYGNLGNYDKAFYYAEKLLEKEPSNYYALFALGNYHFMLEELDSAEFYYNKVLEIRPSYARAYIHLARIYEKQNKNEHAVVQYLNAIELFNANNFKEEVILFSKQVLSLDPNNKLAKEYLRTQ